MKLFLATAMCTVLMTLAAPTLADSNSEEALIERVLAAHQIPAMSLVVIRGGKAGPEVVRGVRKMGGETPVRMDERWLLGSNTKAMTAVLIGRLVEQGKLNWTSRLDAMLPMLAKEMRAQYRDLTLLDLLSHFGGLPEGVSRAETDPAYVDYVFADRRDLSTQRLEYLGYALADPPVVTPRTRHSYSNTDFILAAAIAERVEGKPYEQLMRDLVFRPLRMSSATFAEAKSADLQGHMNGRVEQPKDGNPAIFNGAGEVRMTMTDWAKFCVDQLQGARGNGRLLSPETYKLLQTAYMPIGDPAATKTDYGLGWQVARSVMGRKGPAIFHSGSDGVWIADVWLFPESGNGLLVATNSAYSMGAQKAIAEVARELLPTLAPAATETGQPPPK